MPAIHLLKEYNQDILQSFIDNEIEESINIEFKSSGAISRTPSVKKEMSKDVSAFANSDGGIIIYSMEEKHHKAHKFSYVDGNEFTKEFLEQVINSTIKRAIPNLRIHAVRANGNVKESIYIVQIPSSIDAPHMGQDKRFYRRHDFESVMMEEYEVRLLYGRKVKSELQISSIFVSIHPEDGEDDETRLKFILSVENIGEILVKDYRANLYFEGELNYCNMNWEAVGQGKHYSYTLLAPEVQFTNENSVVIYPTEILDVLSINFDVKTVHLETFIRNLKLRAKVFYENQQSAKIFDMQDMMLKDYLARTEEFTFLKEKQGIDK